jgi:hypothetical protein
MYERSNLRKPTSRATRSLSWILCALAVSSCTSVISSCPTPVPYSQDEKNQAAAEIERAVTDGYVMLPRMVGDYKSERAQLRACFN